MPRDVDAGVNRDVGNICLSTIYFHKGGKEQCLCVEKDGSWGIGVMGSRVDPELRVLRGGGGG